MISRLSLVVIASGFDVNNAIAYAITETESGCRNNSKERKQVMEDTREEAIGYWCHRCNQMVDPIVEVETIKCPLCLGGFLEEMDTTPATASQGHHNHRPTDFEGRLDSDHSLSLWAPVLLSMMSNPRRRRRFRRRLEFAEDEDDEDRNEQSENIDQHHHHHHRHHGEGEIELNRELESIIRRRRSSETILQLLQGIRAGIQSASQNNAQSDISNRDQSNNRGRERVILINPFNQTIIVQSSYGSNNNSENQNQNSIGSLGDYFIGPGFDLLLQHLAENDPNRYGTPPAQKDAVEAMPTVKIVENLQCSVCLEYFEIGAEGKEMPCKHKFHSGCILPWLELHSSCPFCRHQLPIDKSKLNSEVLRNNISNGNNSSRGEGEGRNENGRRFSVPLPWPFSSLFSSSDSSAANANSSSTLSSSGSSTNAFGNSTRTDEN